MECKYCGRQFNVEDIDPRQRLAKCRNCQEVFSFADPASSRETSKLVESRRRRAPQPACVQIGGDGSTCWLRWRWSAPHLLHNVLFCVVWDSVLVYWYYMTFANVQGPAFWRTVILPVGHLAVGIGMTYWTLAGFMNRTIVAFDGATLRVSHGPVPWRGRKLDAAAIEQVYCRERKQRPRRVRSVYDVFAVLSGNRRVRLLNRLINPGHALFVEDQIEGWLGLPDEIVPGELKASSCSQRQ
jgi:hypothetical protein